MALSISEDDHVDARHAPGTAPCSLRLITHFYVKKLTEEQIKEVEQASASTATDHGQEVVLPRECQIAAIFPNPMLCSPLLLISLMERSLGWSESLSTLQKMGEASPRSCRTRSSGMLAPSCSTLYSASTCLPQRTCTKPSSTH